MRKVQNLCTGCTEPSEAPGNPFEEGDSENGSQSEISESKLDDKLKRQRQNPFHKLISGAFTPHLGIYVRSQEQCC